MYLKKKIKNKSVYHLRPGRNNGGADGRWSEHVVYETRHPSQNDRFQSRSLNDRSRGRRGRGTARRAWCT